MYYKIRKDILWRNEKNSLMILHPVSKKLMIFGKDISDFVSVGGVIDGSQLKNTVVIDRLIAELLVDVGVSTLDPNDQLFGSQNVVSAPLNVTIQVTNRCNLTCKHCHRVDQGCLDLDKHRLIALIDELSEMKVFNINLSGGEPLLYTGLSDIISHILSKGMKVTMSTNLVLRDEAIASKMYALGLRQLHVSLDSADETYHNYIRGQDTAYALTRKNIEIIKKVGMQFTLVTTLVNQSLSDYAKVIDLAYELGAGGHKTNILIPQGQGQYLEVGYYKDKDLLKSYIDIFVEKKKYYHQKMSVIGETMFALSIGEYDYKKPDILKLGCPAGVLTAAITEKGEVLACPFYSEISLGNIYDSGFKHIWEKSELLGNIRTCKNNCNSGCQARAYGITKSIEGEDPYTYKNIYGVDSHDFYDNSADSRDQFISTIGHGMQILGEKGNKEFYGLIHNHLLDADLTLEIGTGNGIVPKTLGKLGKKIISVDFSDNMLRLAKENCRIYDNVTFQKEDVHDLSFKDNTFDLVIKRLAPDDLGQIFRVVKKGGDFINFTNGEKDGKELKDLFGLPYHESAFDYKTQLLRQGFTIAYEAEFEFKEVYSTLDILIKMLHIAPIIPDFLERKAYYIKKITNTFDVTNGFVLTRHKYLVHAKK